MRISIIWEVTLVLERLMDPFLRFMPPERRAAPYAQPEGLIRARQAAPTAGARHKVRPYRVVSRRNFIDLWADGGTSAVRDETFFTNSGS